MKKKGFVREVTSEKESSEEDGLEHVHKDPRVVVDAHVKGREAGTNAKASVDHVCPAERHVGFKGFLIAKRRESSAVSPARDAEVQEQDDQEKPEEADLHIRFTITHDIKIIMI